jgi:poly-gamma-glutamate synthesis protein (capsule biosynthesis protein)
VTLAFAGDVHFMEELAPRLVDPETALEPVAEQLSAADVTVVNLETAITERGRPEPKTYTFRAPAAALDALAAAGVDVATMANNHAVDFGADGLADTLAAVAGAPLQVIGVGAVEDEAFAPAVVDVRGTRVAVLAATQVPDRTMTAWSASATEPGVASARPPDRLIQAVEDAGESADVVVVYLHYGMERVSCPVRAQRALVDDLVAAGADVVVGSHAHVLLGAGWQDAAYVSYGLGNFAWYSPNSVREGTSGVLTLTLDGDRVVADDFTPVRIGEQGDGLPREVTGPDRRRAVQAWRDLRGCTGLSARPPA